MANFSNPLLCAVDMKDVSEAKALCNSLKGVVGGIKLGLEFFCANGPQGVEAIGELGIPIFLDLKFHDIPNTVKGAVSSAMQLDISMLTIHTTGGLSMMQYAVDAAKEAVATKNCAPPLIVGVTVLTSMAQSDLTDLGIEHDLTSQAERYAALAKRAGLDGIVCSAHEAAQIKTICGNHFKTVVPGIRPKQSDNSDQKRVVTPKEAIGNGADYIVVGRPITQSSDPQKAAADIISEIQ